MPYNFGDRVIIKKKKIIGEIIKVLIDEETDSVLSYTARIHSLLQVV